jgi:hypothetical protein
METPMNTKWHMILMLCLLASVLLSGAGCVHEQTSQEVWSDVTPNTPSAQRPVTADQVTPENARAVLQALRAEVPSARPTVETVPVN